MPRAAVGGLDPAQDAYGQMLLAAFEGRRADEIMERDDGLIYRGDPADYFDPFRRWPANERRAMRFVRGRVLDAGCAVGRVSLYLQGRGHEVVAIDESPLAVEVARRRGVLDARVASLLDVDESLGTFDTVLIVRNNFGLAGTPAKAKELIRRLARITNDAGRLVTDSVDPARIDPADLPTYGRARHRGWGYSWRVRVRYRTFATPWFFYVMLPPDELGALVEGSGWRVANVIDDGTPRYSVVLEKVLH